MSRHRRVAVIGRWRYLTRRLRRRHVRVPQDGPPLTDAEVRAFAEVLHCWQLRDPEIDQNERELEATLKLEAG